MNASRTTIVGISVVVAAGLLFAAWQFDRTLPASRQERSAPIEELVAPRPLSEAERAAAQDRRGGSLNVQIDQKAWVQVAGKDGRLAQQYMAEKIDPQPGAFMAMVEPRTVFFLEDGRVATLRARTGRVHVPNRALESGTFNGDVVIRVFRPAPGVAVNLAKDIPSLVLESEQLDFDQVLGEIQCETAFRLTTDVLTFDGAGLDLLLGRDGKSIERLTVEHPLGPIVIDRSRQNRARASAAPKMVDMTPISWKRERDFTSHAATGVPVAVIAAQVASPVAAPVAAPSARFYRLEMHDDVEVLRYTAKDRAWSKGDLLVAIFSLQSDLIAKEMVMIPAEDMLPAARQASTPQVGITARIAQSALAVAPDPVGDLLVIRFTGRLKMEPVDVDEKVPDSADGMKIQIDGKAVELANQGGLALRGEKIDMDLGKDVAGRTTPKLLIATGAVEATDVAQTLWCDALRAEFVSTETEAKPRAAQDGDPPLGPSEVARVDAESAVQIQMKDGARVFAQGMTAFPPQGKSNLRGPDLVIIRSGVMIDSIPALAVDDRQRTAQSAGGGRARSWQSPIVAADQRGRIAIPSVPSTKVEMDAQWKGQMTYRDLGQTGATLDLSQDVRVRAEPRVEEFDALDAQTVHLEFERRPAPGGALATAVQSFSPTATGGEVRPRRLIATGDARLENQLWTDAQRTGEPRLFQVRGQTINYDTVTGEASVPGAGSVLVNIPGGASVDPKAAQNRDRDRKIPGGGLEGVSKFSWVSAMNLKPLVDGKFLMTMDRSVEVVRAGLKSSDTMTLTCDRLEATLQRQLEAVAPLAGASMQTFSMGGSSEIQRVRGIGHCFVRTPDYDVECEEFDYNPVTQIAEMRARAGRLVNVLPKGQGTPLRAAAMTWDLASGRIQIRSATGSVGQ